MTKFFSLPADFKVESIDKYYELNGQYKDSKVIETYGQLTVGSIIESGRSTVVLPAVDFKGLEKYVKYAKERDIDFNYTLNASHMQNKEFSQEGLAVITDFLAKIREIGIKSLTIALPTLIEITRNTKLGFQIKASAICQINNVNKAMAFKKLGAERIVIDEALNRDFSKLKSIRESFGEGVEIIINSLCQRDCIYKMFHYNYISADTSMEQKSNLNNFYYLKCMQKRYGKPANILKIGWVRPEDLRYYVNIGINHFKLQGRQFVIKGDPVKTLKAYFEEDFDGNLIDILDMFDKTYQVPFFVDNKKLNGYINPYLKEQNFCKFDCDNCNYCNNFSKEAVSYI